MEIHFLSANLALMVLRLPRWSSISKNTPVKNATTNSNLVLRVWSIWKFWSPQHIWIHIPTTSNLNRSQSPARWTFGSLHNIDLSINGPGNYKKVCFKYYVSKKNLLRCMSFSWLCVRIWAFTKYSQISYKLIKNFQI